VTTRDDARRRRRRARDVASIEGWRGARDECATRKSTERTRGARARDD
jgi:hypothetical protein